MRPTTITIQVLAPTRIQGALEVTRVSPAEFAVTPKGEPLVWLSTPGSRYAATLDMIRLSQSALQTPQTRLDVLIRLQTLLRMPHKRSEHWGEVVELTAKLKERAA
jgi:hypothetical protein